MRIPALFVLIVLLVSAASLSGCTWGGGPAETSDPSDDTDDADGPDNPVNTGPSGPTEPPAAREQIILQRDQLTQAVAIPGTGGDLLVLERGGSVLFMEAGSEDGAQILDLSDRVDDAGDRERGLKGAAFHPDFEENGMVFFVYDGTYDPDEGREGYGHVARYFADPGNVAAGLEEGDVLLEVEFTGNWFHNMGGMGFGPDGMLYVGLGDGASDRMNAQDTSTLLGSILRLNVDAEEGYAIPGDNPFVDDDEARGEVWLYGLRNPWRFDFHPGSGDLFVANAGEDAVESVYRFPGDHQAPRNHGWPYMEGDEPFRDYGEPPEEVNLPIVTFATSDEGRCAMVGGAVYQGERFPEVQGKFVFSDHCSAQLMYAEQVDGGWELREWFSLEEDFINSVDKDHQEELLVVGMFGRLYEVVPG